jgi:hypothetical protein
MARAGAQAAAEDTAGLIMRPEPCMCPDPPNAGGMAGRDLSRRIVAWERVMTN